MAKHTDLRRAKPKRKPKPLMVLFSEGIITEPEYLNGINQYWGNQVSLVFRDCGTDPKGIVKAAAEAKKRSKRLKKSDPNEEIEEIWCIFDRDDHRFVKDAFQQADANEIPVAFSNPCIELWLLLHFQEQTAHLEREEASRLCRNHMPNYVKSPDMALLLPGLLHAERRARALCIRQRANQLPRSNPWTNAYELVEAIRRLSNPQPV